jgi:hypothetical protein
MGLCKQCGECCKWLTFHRSVADNDLNYLKVRGAKMVKDIAYFYHPCPELLGDGLCGIFNRRPRFCHSGYETNYDSLKLMGCKFDEAEQDPNVLKIHATETTGMYERVR